MGKQEPFLVFNELKLGDAKRADAVADNKRTADSRQTTMTLVEVGRRENTRSVGEPGQKQVGKRVDDCAVDEQNVKVEFAHRVGKIGVRILTGGTSGARQKIGVYENARQKERRH